MFGNINDTSRFRAPQSFTSVPTKKQRLQTTGLRATKKPPPPKPTKDNEETRFRRAYARKWNPAQSRWERVKGGKFNSEKYSMEKWEEGGMSTIQTKTGGSYVVWPVIHAYLTDKKVKSVSPEEASRLQEKGAILVDCRVPWDYERETVEGAVSVPLWRGVAGTTAWDTLKRGIMAVGFAMKATERNPDFKQICEDRLPDKKQKIIVLCGLGGTLEVGAQPYKPGGKSFKDDPERMFGRESRSLKGCYELIQAGYKDVLHLKGGLSQWRHDGYPTQ